MIWTLIKKFSINFPLFNINPERNTNNSSNINRTFTRLYFVFLKSTFVIKDQNKLLKSIYNHNLPLSLAYNLLLLETLTVLIFTSINFRQTTSNNCVDRVSFNMLPYQFCSLIPIKFVLKNIDISMLFFSRESQACDMKRNSLSTFK